MLAMTRAAWGGRTPPPFVSFRGLECHLSVYLSFLASLLLVRLRGSEGTVTLCSTPPFVSLRGLST